MSGSGYINLQAIATPTERELDALTPRELRIVNGDETALIPTEQTDQTYPTGFNLVNGLYRHAFFWLTRNERQKDEKLLTSRESVRVEKQMEIWSIFVLNSIVAGRDRSVQQQVQAMIQAGALTSAADSQRVIAVQKFLFLFFPTTRRTVFRRRQLGDDQRQKASRDERLESHRAVKACVDALSSEFLPSKIIDGLKDESIITFIDMNLPLQNPQGRYTFSEVLALWLGFLSGVAGGEEWKTVDHKYIQARVEKKESAEYQIAKIVQVLPFIISDMVTNVIEILARQ